MMKSNHAQAHNAQANNVQTRKLQDAELQANSQPGHGLSAIGRLAKPRHTTLQFAAKLTARFVVSVGLMAGALGFSSVAQAASYGLVAVVMQDGGIVGPLNDHTEAYCGAGATVTGTGCDYSANDGFVRTNDQIKYSIDYNINGGNDTNVTIASTVPAGFMWANLPGFCTGAGSALSANKRSITCNVGAKTSGTAESLQFFLTVAGASNAATIAPTVTITGASGGTATAMAPVTTVTAAPRVSGLMGFATRTINSGTFSLGPASYNPALNGFSGRVGFALLVDNTDGKARLGHEGLSAPFSVDITISGSIPNARLFTLAEGGGSNCGPAQMGNISAGNLPSDSVVNAGTCALTMPSPGVIRVTFTGTDSTAWNAPTNMPSVGAIPAANVLIGQYAVNFFIPFADVDNADGILGNGAGTANYSMTLSNGTPALNLTGSSLTGVPNPASIDKTLDNTVTAYAQLSTLVSYSKFNRGSNRDPGGQYAGIYPTTNQEGPATPGQHYSSILNYNNSGTNDVTNVVQCDVLDIRYQGVTLPVVLDIIQYRTGFSTYLNLNGAATNSLLNPYVVEYASGYVTPTWPPTSGAPATGQVAQECEDPSVAWTTSTAGFSAAVPITKWRVKYATLLPSMQANAYLEYTVKAGPSGSILPNYMIAKADGQTGAGGVLGAYNINNYNPFSNNTIGALGAGGNGKRVFLTNAITSITKKTDDPLSAAAHPTDTINNVTVGGTLRYYLSPTLTTGTNALADVTVTDILPAGLSYVSSAQAGVNTPPTTITPCTGAAAPVAACTAAGQTVLVWNLGVLTANSVIPPIVLNVICTSNANLTLLNTAIVSSTSDISLPAARTATRSVGVQTIAGITLVKSHFPPTLEVPGGPITYTLSYINNTGVNLTKMEVIDVLPFIGDGRTPATSFTGSIVLNTISGLPTGVAVEYTKAAPATVSNDPTHASNQVAGSTVWCAALSGGTCPASLAQVTAVRFTDTSVILSGVTRNVSFSVQTTANSSNLTQVVSNQAGGDSDATVLPVYSNQVSTTYIQASLAGRVYQDINNNGVFDATEPGIAGVCVTLQGSGTGGTDGPYSMLTDASGQYNFVSANGIFIYPTANCTGTVIGAPFAGLRSGTYSVTEQVPHPVVAGQTTQDSGTSATAGIAGGTVGSNTVTAITIAKGEVLTGYNFGELLPPTMSGKVFMDADANGVDTANAEVGIANVLITLTGLDDLGATVTLYACTDNTGAYSFTGSGRVQVGGAAPVCSGGAGLALNPAFAGLRLPDATGYTLTETQPAGYNNSTPSSNVGTGATTATGTSGVNTITGIRPTYSDVAIRYNFGEVGSLVSGNVFNDTNGVSDTFVNGSPVNGTAAPFTTLTAYLVNSAGTIVASSPISATGTYSFSNIVAATGYTVVLSNVAGTTGLATGINTALPAGWVSTAEVNGPSATTANTETLAALGDGKSAPFAVTGVDVTNINFGIEQPPAAGIAAVAIQPNPGTTATAAVPASAFTGIAPPATVTGTYSTDTTLAPATGGVTSINIPSFPTNTTSITINGIVYVASGATAGQTNFPVGGVTVTTALLAGMAIDPIDGITTSVISYKAVDAAGKLSANTGTVSLSFSGVNVSGNVFNDTNGVTDTFVNGSPVNGTAAPFTTLTAYLVNSSNLVVATSLVNASGVYSFSGIGSGNYSMVLSNTAATAASIGVAPPAPSLPAGWVNTAEVNGPSATTANTETAAALGDGKSAVFAVAGADVTNINFGIEQPPVAGAAVYTSVPNPGGTANVTVAAGAFAGTLPASGLTAGSTNATDPTLAPATGGVTSIKFSGFPANATTMTLNGVVYVASGAVAGQTNFPVGGVTVPVAGLTVSVDPVDGASNIVIPYFAVDAGGKLSNTAGSVTVTIGNPGKIDVVKAAGVPKQISAKIFEIDYSVLVVNVGAGSPTVYNVQANDNLKATFPTATTITVSNYAVTAAGGATCTPAASYLGTAASSALLSGTNDLVGGQSCVITFKARVDYGAAAVPATAQNNTAYASGMGVDTTPNPGTTVPDVGAVTYPVGNTTTDISVTAAATVGAPGTLPATPTAPAIPGGDAPAGSPTAVTLTPQQLDVVKAAGVPKQTGPKVFAIDYSVVVGNVGATSPTVYNVQANDNLKATYPTAATITVSNYAVTAGAGTPAGNCTPAASYLGTAASSALLSGNDDLAGGQSCLVTFKVSVDFGAAAVPAAVQNNSAYASGVGSNATTNPGYSITDAGAATAPAVATTTDISVTAAATVGAPGTLPATPALPATRGSDTVAGTPTPVTLKPQQIDVVKAAGVPLQISAKIFEVNYSIVVANVGAASPTVYNVQANDNLKATYPTASTIIVSNYAVAAGAGTPAGICLPATTPAFAGTAAASGLLSGTGDLVGGQSCVITFKARVDYGAAAVPATAQSNTAYGSGMGVDATPNPGYTVPDSGAPVAPAGATITDISVSAPATSGAPGTLPATPVPPATGGSDTVAGSPTNVSFTPQQIDVVKAAGVPLQVAPKIFEISYSVVVANVGATSPTVYNVQANDNLKTVFPTAASIVVSNYVVTAGAGTPAGICLPATTPVFAGTAAASGLLSGTADLAGGQSCVITFKARVDFGAAAIPATAQGNLAYASGVGSDATVNPGYTVPDVGTPVPPAVATTTDISVGAPATTGAPGTLPATPVPPTTRGGDAAAGSPTNVTLTPQKVDAVKAAGVPKQIGPKVFEVSYSVVVANVCKTAPLSCATTPTVFNAQANDNLALTFPTAASITVSNYLVANGANGAVCTPALTPFTGAGTGTAMLSGANDLTGGQTCIVSFKATVDFGSNAIPTTAQNNLVYASGVGADNILNPGYTFPVGAAPVPPANASTTDISATAAPTTGAPGTLPATPLPPTVAGADIDTGVATPVLFVVEEDGELLIAKKTITQTASAGDVIEYVVTVSNTSSNPVKASITDTPPVGFTYVAGSAKIGAASIPSSNSTGALVFDIGTIPAKGVIELRYKMTLGDTVEAGDATNCVIAQGTNTLTANAKESGKTCANVVIKTGLFLEKRANVTTAELGDSVEYSLRVKSVGGTTKNVAIYDKLPLGFKLIEGTVKVIRAGVTNSMANPAGSPGPALTFNVGTVANKEVVEIRYRLRLGIGADLGDGINKAQAKAPYAASSLVATAKVLVTRGVFTREACIAGKVFVDCNQNKLQDACIDDATGKCTGGEPGIPGVRLYMEDGTNITTDENGQYSLCGVRAISHVIQVDMTTMPIGSRMGITSNENLGSGKSLLLNIKSGELHRADFIESSCYPKILDQVEQRRQNSAAVVNVPLTQTGQDKAGMVFDAKEQELLAPALRGVK
jgi:uncharacterized repeat protein (TIGR01451 family)